MNTPSFLYDKLLAYTASEAYPFHMPGHKRRIGSMADPFSIDITEIDGFDDLHHAEGILKEAQARAAQLYGTMETLFLVNGSTCGILTAISASIRSGASRGKGGLAMARNAHRSAYHAAYLEDLQPAWLMPERAELTFIGGQGQPGSLSGRVRQGQPADLSGRGGQAQTGDTPVSGRISPAEVERVLSADPSIGTVFIVSPTYDGVISDVRSIAAVTHAHGAVLIVDEAHGAHYGLADSVPCSAVQQGADLVIHSLHKTMPSLTQTALLHICSERVDKRLLRRFARIYQTSSPSYVLLSSIDQCIRWAGAHAEGYLAFLADMLERFYAGMADLRMLRIAHADDPSRILILPGVSALSGKQICDMLRSRYGLELEMAAPQYALALCSAGDDEEGLVRLSEALHRIDEEAYLRQHFGERSTGDAAKRAHGEAGRNWQETAPGRPGCTCQGAVHREAGNVWQGIAYSVSAGICPERACSLKDAWDGEQACIPIGEASGRIAGEFVYLYPPGIPLVVPGEVISTQVLSQIAQASDVGFELHGMEMCPEPMLWVLNHP